MPAEYTILAARCEPDCSDRKAESVLIAYLILAPVAFVHVSKQGAQSETEKLSFICPCARRVGVFIRLTDHHPETPLPHPRLL
jgi:hypothetical protein